LLPGSTAAWIEEKFRASEIVSGEGPPFSTKAAGFEYSVGNEGGTCHGHLVLIFVVFSILDGLRQEEEALHSFGWASAESDPTRWLLIG